MARVVDSVPTFGGWAAKWREMCACDQDLVPSSAAATMRPPQAWPRPFVLAAVLYISIAVAVGYGALDGPFVLDDLSKVAGNPDIRRIDLSRLVYPYARPDNPVLRRNDPSRPLVFLTYMLDYATCGGTEGPTPAPRCFRRTNIMIHVANSLLVLQLACIVLPVVAPSLAHRGHQRHRIATAAGALFLISPLNWGTATYVYARSDLLGAMSVLGYLVLLLHTLYCPAATEEAVPMPSQAGGAQSDADSDGADTEPPSGSEDSPAGATTDMAPVAPPLRRWKRHEVTGAVAAVLLVAGLCSKQTSFVAVPLLAVTVLWPATIPATTRWRSSRYDDRDACAGGSGGSAGEDAEVTSPPRALSHRQELLLYVVDASVALAALLAARWYYLGGVGDLEAQSLPPTFLYWSTQPYAGVRYLLTLLWPMRLAIDHHIIPQDMPPETLALGVFAACMLGAVAINCGVRALRRARPAPLQRVAFYGLCWFAVCVAPFSVAVTVDAYVERRAYLASVGVYVAVAAGLVWWGGQLWSRGVSSTGARSVVGSWLLAVLVVAWWATLSRQRATTVFATEVSVWEDVLQQYPQSVRGLNNLGTALTREGRAKEAETQFQTLLKLHPRDWRAMSNLGTLALKAGRSDDAAAYFRRALQINPSAAQPTLKLATVLHQRGEAEEALGLYARAMDLDSTLKDLHNNYGLLLHALGHVGEARQVFHDGLTLHPGDELLLRNWGIVYG